MGQQYPQSMTPYQQPAQKSGKKRPGAVTAVFALVLILAVAVILNESLFKIRPVAVVGNDRVSWAEVIRAAGLDKPTNYFAVNEERIAQGISANRYLVFQKLEKHFPNGLTIYVRERRPVAKTQEMGALFTLDAEGMVLERAARQEQTDEAADALIVITGLKPKELRVGKIMTAGSTEHMAAYRALLEELSLQGWLQEISELNLTDPENLYLITRDGYTAHLGDQTQLRPKIGTVRAVVAELRRLGKSGGMLEASIPAEIIYTPATP